MSHLNDDKQATLSAFYDKVLAQIPYYKHAKHITATLKSMGYDGYNPDKEDDMLAILQTHANYRRPTRRWHDGQ